MDLLAATWPILYALVMAIVLGLFRGKITKQHF